VQLDWEPILAWFARNRGRAVGAAVGFVVGLLMLILGFWRGLFLAGCVWLGWVVGAQIDAHESLTALINRLLPPGE
jgi:uncharacterized membrane protein